MRRGRRLAAAVAVAAATASAAPVASAFAAAGAGDPSAAPPLTSAELMTLRNVGDPQISPDGSRVAYVITEPDLGRRAHVGDLWLVGSDGSAARRLTFAPGRDDTPRWAPDGRTLAFLSDRVAPPQIWLIAPDGGEARQLTTTKSGIGLFQWSPDSRSIAFVSQDADAPAADAKATTAADIVIGDAPPRASRLWTIDVATGTARALTADRFSVDDFSWSPRGDQIVLSARPTGKVPDMFRADIFKLAVATGEVTEMVVRPGADASPRWSPDGKSIAFVSNTEGNDWICNWYTYVMPAEGGEPRNVSRALDEFTINSEWAADSKHLRVVAWQGLASHLFQIDASSGEVKRLSEGPYAYSLRFSASADGKRVALLRSDPTTPPEVYVATLDPFTPHRVTTTNPMLLERALGKSERLEWKGTDGTAIEGLLVTPASYQPGSSRLPLLTYVHGGPAGRFNYGFNSQLTDTQPVQAESFPPHVLAGLGYAVLMTNPRGSNGYGEKFRKMNRKDWGFGDYQDIMAGVDEVIRRGIADPDRLGIMGRSYGGYMTAWVITQTQRFKAASLGAAMVNLVSFYGQTDIPGFLEFYFDGDPWTAREEYERHSPINFAPNVTTPTLILQGERDARVPLPQVEELRRALEKHDVPVELIVLPGQGHLPADPLLQRESITRNIAWFGKWLGMPGAG